MAGPWISMDFHGFHGDFKKHLIAKMDEEKAKVEATKKAAAEASHLAEDRAQVLEEQRAALEAAKQKVTATDSQNAELQAKLFKMRKALEEEKQRSGTRAKALLDRWAQQ